MGMNKIRAARNLKYKPKAEFELSQVQHCTRKARENLDVTKQDIAKLNKDILDRTAKIKELYKQGAMNYEINILADEIKLDKYQIESYQQMTIMLSKVVTSFSELEGNIKQAMTLGWYKYVVRVVPEKKLPNLVGSENPEALKYVYDLVVKITNKIKMKISGTLITTNEGRKQIDSANKFGNDMIKSAVEESGVKVDEKTGLTSDAMDILNDLGIDAPDIVPVDVTANNSDDNTSDNTIQA